MSCTLLPILHHCHLLDRNVLHSDVLIYDSAIACVLISYSSDGPTSPAKPALSFGAKIVSIGAEASDSIRDLVSKTLVKPVYAPIVALENERGVILEADCVHVVRVRVVSLILNQHVANAKLDLRGANVHMVLVYCLAQVLVRDFGHRVVLRYFMLLFFKHVRVLFLH